MTKIVFAGDSLFTGEHGFYPSLESSLLLNHPSTDCLMDVIHKDCETFSDVFHYASAVIIGRAPKYIALSLGHRQISGAEETEIILKQASAALKLLKDKTGAQIFCGNVVTGILGQESVKVKAGQFNQELVAVCRELGVSLVDFNHEVENFLHRHRVGNGEKRSLYFQGPELYPIGQALLAGIYFQHLNRELPF